MKFFIINLISNIKEIELEKNINKPYDLKFFKRRI